MRNLILLSVAILAMACQSQTGSQVKNENIKSGSNKNSLLGPGYILQEILNTGKLGQKYNLPNIKIPVNKNFKFIILGDKPSSFENIQTGNFQTVSQNINWDKIDRILKTFNIQELEISINFDSANKFKRFKKYFEKIEKLKIHLFKPEQIDIALSFRNLKTICIVNPQNDLSKIAEIKTVKSLKIVGSRLNKQNFNWLSGMPQLRKLEMVDLLENKPFVVSHPKCHFAMNSKQLKFVKKLKKLEYLRLSRIDSLESIGILENLKVLKLYSVESKKYSTIDKFKKLEFLQTASLDLPSGNDGIMYDDLIKIFNLKKLKHLNLAIAKIDSKKESQWLRENFFAKLSQLHDLNSLGLASCYMPSFDYKNMHKLNLVSLDYRNALSISSGMVEAILLQKKLQTLRFKIYAGCEYDIKSLRRILENTKTLHDLRLKVQVMRGSQSQEFSDIIIPENLSKLHFDFSYRYYVTSPKEKFKPICLPRLSSAIKLNSLVIDATKASAKDFCLNLVNLKNREIQNVTLRSFSCLRPLSATLPQIRKLKKLKIYYSGSKKTPNKSLLMFPDYIKKMKDLHSFKIVYIEFPNKQWRKSLPSSLLYLDFDFLITGDAVKEVEISLNDKS